MAGGLPSDGKLLPMSLGLVKATIVGFRGSQTKEPLQMVGDSVGHSLKRWICERLRDSAMQAEPACLCGGVNDHVGTCWPCRITWRDISYQNKSVPAGEDRIDHKVDLIIVVNGRLEPGEPLGGSFKRRSDAIQTLNDAGAER
ncbi:hypothetical protein Bbelb_010000 [Branchiostoma belcheri]|nr:hypothetical protein Bbelb_010000 [Branchiostoma belcheri]